MECQLNEREWLAKLRESQQEVFDLRARLNADPKQSRLDTLQRQHKHQREKIEALSQEAKEAAEEQANPKKQLARAQKMAEDARGHRRIVQVHLKKTGEQVKQFRSFISELGTELVEEEAKAEAIRKLVGDRKKLLAGLQHGLSWFWKSAEDSGR